MSPFFSIIIPSFNAENTIITALESILQQTFKDFEIRIVDGLSTDKTLEIIRGIDDNRIIVHSDKDKGIYDAMNKGIHYAQGEWLYFIGSDDYLYNNDVLQTLSQTLNKAKNHVIYGNVLINGNTGWATDRQVYNGKYSFQKLLKSNICHQSMFYRRSFILKNQLEYDLKYPISSDWDFNIACRLQSKFTFINTIVAVFNAGGISTGKSITEPFLEERKVKYAHLYEKYKPNIMQRLKYKINALIKKVIRK
ncbi:glycosyltransferase family 2 protein [Flavobacterium luteum]|uniref:Glycosyltransferase n=1 Tax=Flavobacterium luteum TaxID=2026654 RepID=A0A7J5AE60_9FLAO|nr:glycosyltransferase family 2 protein [Flavobacterium luteum]KAB1155825.1 glycosyltransferase [Flavobacterium luteum]